MNAPPVDLGAARGVLIRHHRRAGTDRCARCGGRWERATVYAPLAGCAARRYVATILLATGLLGASPSPGGPQ